MDHVVMGSGVPRAVARLEFALVAVKSRSSAKHDSLRRRTRDPRAGGDQLPGLQINLVGAVMVVQAFAQLPAAT